MARLFLPTRKLSESTSLSAAASTNVNKSAHPSPSSPSTTVVDPVPPPNTTLSSAPLPSSSSSHGSHHSQVAPPVVSRLAGGSGKRSGPPRIVACVVCHKQKKRCGAQRPCERCVSLSISCVEQTRPDDGFQYNRKKKRQRTSLVLEPQPGPPVLAPFPGNLWASVAQQTSHDNPVYQRQLPSPSPSLSMVGMPSDSLYKRDLSYQGSGPGGSNGRSDQGLQVTYNTVEPARDKGNEAPQTAGAAATAPPSPSPEPDSIESRPIPATIIDFFGTNPDLVSGPSTLDSNVLPNLEADLDLELQLFGTSDSEKSLHSIEGCNALDTPTLSEITTRSDKGGGGSARGTEYAEIDWETWNKEFPLADVDQSPSSFFDLDTVFDFLGPPIDLPVPMAAPSIPTPQSQPEDNAEPLAFEKDEDRQNAEAV